MEESSGSRLRKVAVLFFVSVGLFISVLRYANQGPVVYKSIGYPPERGAAKTILVTGVASFLGTHTARALKERGDTVLGVYTQTSDPLEASRLQLLKKDNVKVEDINLCDTERFGSYVKDHKITDVLYLDEKSGALDSMVHSSAFMDQNVICFNRALDALKEAPDVFLTYSSSHSVYGQNSKLPLSESNHIGDQKSVYGATMRSRELLATSYSHMFGLHSTGLRLFPIYGPLMPFANPVFQQIDRIMHAKPISLVMVMGREIGSDLTYIDDAVRAVVSALDLRADSEIINVGNKRAVSEEKLAKEVQKASHRNTVFNYDATSNGLEDLMTYADTVHADKILGYVPTTSLSSGVRNSVEWYNVALDEGIRTPAMESSS